MSSQKLLLLLTGITVVIYFFSFNSPFIWDDEQFITKNIYVQNFDIEKILTTNTVAGAGVQSNYYRPLTTFSFALDYKIWGANPFGFHLTNTVLHIGAGLLLFLLLLETGIAPVVSFFVALIFLIHPVQVEAVAYINSRGDSFYALLLFSSVLLFARSLRSRKKKAIFFRILSVTLFLLSMLAKETALVGILLFPLAIFLDWCKHHFRLKQIKIQYSHELWTIGLMIAGAGAYILLRFTWLRFGNLLNYYVLQNAYSQHLWIRLLTFTKVFWIYIDILLFPFRLHMERSVGIVTSAVSVWPVFFVLLLAAMGYLVYKEFRRTHTIYIGTSFLLFLLFLIPVSGIIPINGILYEHWLYLPLIGFYLTIFSLWHTYVPKHNFSAIKSSILFFAVCIMLLYSILSIMQIRIWSDPVAFYTYTLQFTDSPRLRNNLGIEYASRGNIDLALTEYKKAIALSDTYPQTHNNIANIYKAEGKYKDAESEYKKALTMDPSFSQAFFNYVDLYLREKRYSDALIFMEINAGRDKQHTDVTFRLLLGETLYKLGQKDKAETAFQQALSASHNDTSVATFIQQIEQGIR